MAVSLNRALGAISVRVKLKRELEERLAKVSSELERFQAVFNGNLDAVESGSKPVKPVARAKRKTNVGRVAKLVREHLVDRKRKAKFSSGDVTAALLGGGEVKDSKRLRHTVHVALLGAVKSGLLAKQRTGVLNQVEFIKKS